MEQGFPDKTTAVAAVDRLVHHITILKMNVERYNCREALDRSKRKRSHPADHADEKKSRTEPAAAYSSTDRP